MYYKHTAYILAKILGKFDDSVLSVVLPKELLIYWRLNIKKKKNHRKDTQKEASKCILKR